MDEAPSLDPWGTSDVQDYARLFEDFGIEPVEPLEERIPDPHRFITRGLTFGHRDLGRILSAIDGDEPYAVMSGIKPTGTFHLGTKMTAEQIVYWQQQSDEATAFYGIADVEAYCDNGLPFSETSEIAVSNLADILALGLDPDRAYVYKQSEEIRVTNLSFIFSRGVTLNMMQAIYGERDFGLYSSALVQAGDIMLPQTEEFGGPKPVLVPVGVDQDPHIRLARDLARKHNTDFGFQLPSATYHRLALSLTGDKKMSKRDPMSMIELDDDPDLIREKISRAYTGGRETVELHKKLGGEPWRCPVYHLYLYHFAESEDQAKDVYVECATGERVCGDCKAQAADLAVEQLSHHDEKKEESMDVAEDLLEKS